VIAGNYGNTRGPIDDPNTEALYFDVTLEAGLDFAQPVPTEFSAFVYVFEGEAMSGDAKLPRHSLTVLADGDRIDIRASDSGARFILVAGRPINEPIVQYGPFVMTSREEVERAFHDYSNNRLVQKRAHVVS
jgi:redox-sensitive bicupin YhaK (pirin superfamily)